MNDNSRHLTLQLPLKRTLLCLMLVSASNAGFSEDEPAGKPMAVETIVVTGTKRPQKLGRVDSAISVQTGEYLNASGITAVNQLESVFPGLVIDMRGNRNYTNYTLRGLTSGDFYNPSVQVYVDGIPQDPAFMTQELVGLGQVELLRGPQGTLYGRNAQGGIINIISEAPGDTFSGTIDGLYSEYNRHAGLSISGPLPDQGLGASLNIRRHDVTGQIDDIATGKDNVDNSENLLARGILVFAPQDGPLDLTLTFQHADIDSNEELYLADDNLESLTYNSALQGGINEFQREVNSYSFSADYDFGAAVLSSVTSWSDLDISRRVIQGFDTPESQETLTQELKMVIDGQGPISAVAGAFYQTADFQRNTPGFTGRFGAAENKISRDTIAIFGEATYALSEVLDLTAGARWSREEAEIDYLSEAPSALAIQDYESFNDVSPKIALGWQITKGQRLYALASRGFKAGGFNNTIALGEFDPTRDIRYDSEANTNVELGWRGQLLNGRIDSRIALYRIGTKDKQAFVGPIGLQYLRNIGDAESMGIEFESRIIAGDNALIDLGAAIGCSEYKSSIDPLTGADYSDNNVPHAPDTTARLTIDQRFPGVDLPGDLHLRVGIQHVSKTFFDDANTLAQSSYNLVDASIRLEMDNLVLRLFGNNLTDETYRTYSYSQPPLGNFSSVGVGRNIGLQATVTF